MGILRSLFGPSKEEIWSQLAEQVGGQFEEGGFFSSSRVAARVGEWTLTLDTYNANKTVFTRLRAPYINADGFLFTVYPAGFFSNLGAFLGLEDISTGDPSFDEEYVLKGNDPEKVKRFFSDDALKAMIRFQTRLHITVKDDEGWFGKLFPENVDELYFHRQGVMKDLDELRALYDLFSHTLHRLCHLGSAYENDPGVRI